MTHSLALLAANPDVPLHNITTGYFRGFLTWQLTVSISERRFLTVTFNLHIPLSLTRIHRTKPVPFYDIGASLCQRHNGSRAVTTPAQNSRRQFVTTRRILFVTGVFTFLFTMSLFARTFGEVTGNISDASGAAIPASKIYLINTSTNAVLETRSTDSGDYTFAAVAPGIYRIRVEQSSFKTTVSSNFNVLSGAVRPGLAGTAAHANFGVVTSTSGAMRQHQLGLEYSF